MSKARQQTHRRLRRRIHALLTALRPASWDADHIAAVLNGWTLERTPLGRVVVRDPRFDQLRRRNGEPVPPQEAARVRASVTSGRWQ
jgi:hypothetical protein